MTKAFQTDDRNVLWSVIHFLKTSQISGQTLEQRYPGLTFAPDYPDKIESYEIPHIAVGLLATEDSINQEFFGMSGYERRIPIMIYLFAGLKGGKDRDSRRQRELLGSDIVAILWHSNAGSGDVYFDIVEENNPSSILGQASVARVQRTNIPPIGPLDKERFRCNIAVELLVMEELAS